MSGSVVHDFTVDGLRTVVLSNPGIPVAACGLLVGAGSAAESEGQLGYAHFLEHLTFKGSSSMGPREFAFSVERLALDSNAGTGTGLTLYFFDGLSEDLAEGFRLMLECLVDPGFRDYEMDMERGVVTSEFEDCDSDPQTLLEDEVQRTLYAGHPMGRDILGTRGSVASATPEGIRAFHDPIYVRENLTVVLVGDVGRDTAEAMVREHAASVPMASSPVGLPPLPPLAASVSRIPMDIPASNSAWATRSGGRLGRRENAVWEVLADYLAWGQASPLSMRLREDLGLVYFATAEAKSHGCGTDFRFLWAAAPEAEATVMETLREEMERIAAGSFREGRFASVMKHLRLRRLKASQQHDRTLLGVVTEIDSYGSVDTPSSREAMYDGILPRDLSDAAAGLLSQEWALVTVGPQVP